MEGSNGRLVQLFTTVAEEGQARDLARACVESRRAACVQVLGPIFSTYRWEGQVRQEREYLCLMKVPADGLEDLVRFVRERHPYDTPELIAEASTFVEERYLAWARSEVGPG